MIQELRAKKNLMINQMEGEKKAEKESERKSINDLMEKHQNFQGKFINHIEKQSTDQEDQFNKKMKERKDRSISRSLNKSGDNGKGSKTGDEEGGAKTTQSKTFKLYQNNLKFGAEP